MLFNTHSHVDTNRQFEHDREVVLQRTQEMGVGRIMVVGYNRGSIPVSIGFAEQHDWAYAAVGIHPTDAREWDEEAQRLLQAAMGHPKVRAVGEIGLDYYWKDRAPFDVQRDVFRQQIRLARESRRPIVVHDRDAHEDVVKILSEERAEEIGGIMHCFAGDWQIAQRCLELGLYLGVGGTVTYKNNTVCQDVVRRMPLDRLVLETDDPYLAPVPFRGKRNEPGYVRYVAEFVAALRDTTVEEIERKTYENASHVLGLGDGA